MSNVEPLAYVAVDQVVHSADLDVAAHFGVEDRSIDFGSGSVADLAAATEALPLDHPGAFVGVAYGADLDWVQAVLAYSAAAYYGAGIVVARSDSSFGADVRWIGSH